MFLALVVLVLVLVTEAGGGQSRPCSGQCGVRERSVTQRRESNVSVVWVTCMNGSVMNTAKQKEGANGKKKRAPTMIARGRANDDAHMNERLQTMKRLKVGQSVKNTRSTVFE
jgi:hypothetical protein